MPAKKSKATTPADPAVTYRHGTKRKHIPPAGLAAALRNHEPWLEWAGKREKKGFEVDPVALHIHERISTQAILKVAARDDVPCGVPMLILLQPGSLIRCPKPFWAKYAANRAIEVDCKEPAVRCSTETA